MLNDFQAYPGAADTARECTRTVSAVPRTADAVPISGISMIGVSGTIADWLYTRKTSFTSSALRAAKRHEHPSFITMQHTGRATGTILQEMQSFQDPTYANFYQSNARMSALRLFRSVYPHKSRLSLQSHAKVFFTGLRNTLPEVPNIVDNTALPSQQTADTGEPSDFSFADPDQQQKTVTDDIVPDTCKQRAADTARPPKWNSDVAKADAILKQDMQVAVDTAPVDSDRQRLITAVAFPG